MVRFDGAIAGIGTASGTRLVIGMWPRSPFGPVTDVMVERADGHRILLAPTQELADFIAATYAFDEVRVTPVRRGLEGDRWGVVAPDLAVTFRVQGRPGLGWLLSAVPRSVARTRAWTTVIDPVARLTMHGVRTRGETSGGRREWYSALDLHRITDLTAEFDGQDLGELRPVEPAVRFGFGSTPAEPGLTRVLTTVAL
ncbi:hypothetical protein JL106_17195 [Nakamurella sp. YIM 132084]|uniref:Uncharacterized protein n=1 Tax=Nakamurella leprariae TaxID=2803911 RepID=A0A938YFP1_9ACTN|nr:hypothetical protein [Nakamurella leprariae]